MEGSGRYDWLMKAAGDGSLSHAYIFEGKKGGAKAELAFHFARSITPYPEDIHHTKADERSVKDQAVFALQERLSTKPMVGDRTVAIIEDADTMTHRAQNRLLKTLEEPAGGAVIILLSENVENLLPTVLSRCVVVRADRMELEAARETSIAEREAAQAGDMLLSGKPFYQFLPILNEMAKDRQQAFEFLEELAAFVRNTALAVVGIDRAVSWIRLVEEANRNMSRSFNTGYLLKNMVLKMMLQ